MNFFDLIKKRHSIRQYKKREVEKDNIKKILEAAKAAPSAGNVQAYHIFVVKQQVNKDQLALASFGQNFIAQAGVIFVFMADPSRSSSRYGSRGAELYATQDATIACSYAQLAARDLGLGACWVGAFDEERVRLILKAPNEMLPVAILPVGYSAVPGSRSQRRPLKDIFTDS